MQTEIILQQPIEHSRELILDGSIGFFSIGLGMLGLLWYPKDVRFKMWFAYSRKNFLQAIRSDAATRQDALQLM